MINILLKEIGPIDSANIKLNDLTIFTGENNTGKTYITYTITNILENLSFSNSITSGYLNNQDFSKYKNGNSYNLLPFFEENINLLFNKVIKTNVRLNDLFNTSDDFFRKSKIEINFDTNALKNKILDLDFSNSFLLPHSGSNYDNLKIKLIKSKNDPLFRYEIDPQYLDFYDSLILNKYIPAYILISLERLLFNNRDSIFLIPAERSGINLFFKELNVTRNRLVHELSFDLYSKGLKEQKLKKNISLYSKPISNYIDFLNIDVFNNLNNKSDFYDIAYELQKNILGGKYDINKTEQNIYFTSYKSHSKKDLGKINIHLASSTIKTLFSLTHYLTYMAERGDTLVIDEPELNLHPDNQRKLARIFSKIVNRGIRVIITTHSEYIIKELNNLIMLSEDFKSREALLEKYNYSKDSVLDLNKVTGYLIKDNGVSEMDKNSGSGLISKTFDDVINAYNNTSDDIYYTKLEESNSLKECSDE